MIVTNMNLTILCLLYIVRAVAVDVCESLVIDIIQQRRANMYLPKTGWPGLGRSINQPKYNFSLLKWRSKHCVASNRDIFNQNLIKVAEWLRKETYSHWISENNNIRKRQKPYHLVFVSDYEWTTSRAQMSWLWTPQQRSQHRKCKTIAVLADPKAFWQSH